MLRPGVPLVARAETGAKPKLQAIAAARLLALPADALVALLAGAALANPALHLTFDVDDDPPPSRPRIALPAVARVDEAIIEDTSGSLHAHVATQIPLLVRDRSLLPLAHAWLEGLEPSGWVSLTPADVARRCGTDEGRAEYVLHLLQLAEPDGLFARSLRECLTLQLRAQGDLTPAMAAVLENLPLLASGDLATLAERTGILAQSLPGLIGRLRRLNPKPGAHFESGSVALAAPDYLLLRDRTAGWELRQGRWLKPTLAPANAEARHLARDLRRASSLATLVENRDQLVLRTVRHALDWQADYLEGRSPWMRPLALADLASPLGVHETSIGRIRNHVVIGDRNGALRLRDLFVPAIPTVDGPPISPAELSSRIEDARSAFAGPGSLTDEQIRQSLLQSGIAVSRRTVAKYRGSLPRRPFKGSEKVSS